MGCISRDKDAYFSFHEGILFYFLLTDVLGQQQSFRRRPVDVEVKIGATADLKCEVENQAGRVQWTKGGFALGKTTVFCFYSIVIMS